MDTCVERRGLGRRFVVVARHRTVGVIQNGVDTFEEPFAAGGDRDFFDDHLGEFGEKGGQLGLIDRI
jgi:hypothetical protein